MRSVKRMGRSGGGAGPASGEAPVRFSWSAIRTGWPTGQSGFRPPAALVSTISVQPAAIAVRTPWTHVEAGWPS